MATTAATPSVNVVDADDHHHHRHRERFHTPLSATPSVLSALAGGSANKDSVTSRGGASRWVREKQREREREREKER